MAVGLPHHGLTFFYADTQDRSMKDTPISIRNTPCTLYNGKYASSDELDFNRRDTQLRDAPFTERMKQR
jgi:hypothetical protein